MDPKDPPTKRSRMRLVPLVDRRFAVAQSKRPPEIFLAVCGVTTLDGGENRGMRP